MNSQPTPFRPPLAAATHWWQEFSAFFRRGSVVDLAVGVMIGGAFGKIVTSLVTDIISPPLSLVLGRIKLDERKWVLGGPAEAPVTLNYGHFLQSLIEFFLIAVVLFVIISLINRLNRKPAPPPAVPPPPTLDQQLLAEIRDELRQRAK